MTSAAPILLARQAARLSLLLAAVLGHALVLAADQAQVLLPGGRNVVLLPDDTLEMVLIPGGAHKPGRTLEAQAWLIEAQREVPAGRVMAVASPTRPGEYLLHLRGLAPLKESVQASDLLLRWTLKDPGGGAAQSGESRLPGAVAFKNTLPDVTLLIDCSLSMEGSDPQRQRVDAARAFVDTGRRSGSIGRVGIVVFSERVRQLLPLTPLEDAAAFERAFNEIREQGLTDIDGSIRTGLETLRGGANGIGSGALVLLTDGKQEPGEYRNAHEKAREAGIPVHTVGLGKGADRALLKRIAAETGGTFSDANKGEELLHLYAAIAGRIAGGRAILSVPGAQNEATFPVDGSCRALVVAFSGHGDLSLMPPEGAAQTTGIAEHPVQYRMSPTPGKWSAKWSADAKTDTTFSASARTALYPLFFRARAESGAPIEIDPEDPRVCLSLSDGANLLKNAQLAGTLEIPGQPPIAFAPRDDGKDDDAAGDGVYCGSLPALDNITLPADTTGTLRVVATGKRDGVEFRREVTVPWTVRRGGGRTLIVNPALDLGTHWSGSEASAELSLRMRGNGGPLSITHAPPEAGALQNSLFDKLEIKQAPQHLRSRESTRIAFNINLPEDLSPGTYGGTLVFTVAKTADAAELATRVPWQIRVRPPEIVAQPARIELGALAPGARATAVLKLSTRGGRTTISAPNFPELAWNRDDYWPRAYFGRPDAQWLPPPCRITAIEKPREALKLSEQSSEVKFKFAIPADARAGFVEQPIIIRNARGGQQRVIVSARVQPQFIEAIGDLDFGKLEPRDVAERVVRCRLAGARTDATQEVRARAFTNAKSITAVAQSEAAGAVSLMLDVAPGAVDGRAAGTLLLQCGPVAIMRRFSAEIIQPELTVEPATLDFGSLYGGQTRQQTVKVFLKAARPAPAAVSAESVLFKPTLRQVRLPEDALQIAAAPNAAVEPGGSLSVTVNLRVPEAAQDGAYKTQLLVDSRLGRQSIPVALRIVSPIPLPPFHVSPPEVTLRVEDGIAIEPAVITVTSHSDTELPLRAFLVAGEGYTRAPAELSRGRNAPLSQEISLLLPARAEFTFLVKPLPDATEGEHCSIVVEGGGEKQTVRAGVLRFRNLAGYQKKVNDGSSFYDWLIFLIILLIALGVLLVRALVKRRWIRYTVYTLAFHSAFMFMAMPTVKIVDALPESVQLTLLQSQEEMGFEMSAEQARRLQELQAGGGGDSEAGPGARGGGPMGGSAGGGLEGLKQEAAAAGAPAAEAALAQASIEESKPAAPEPAAIRTETEARQDQALAADEPLPQPKLAEPAPSRPEVAAAPAVGHTPLTQDVPDVPLSAEITDTRRTDNLTRAEARTEALSTERVEAPLAATEAPSAERATYDGPTLDEVPLAADAVHAPDKVGTAEVATAKISDAAPGVARSHDVSGTLKTSLPEHAGTTKTLVASKAAAPTKSAETRIGAWVPGKGETLGKGGAGTAVALNGDAVRSQGVGTAVSDAPLDMGPSLEKPTTAAGTSGVSGKALTGNGQDVASVRGVPGGRNLLATGTGPGNGTADIGGLGSGGTGGRGIGPGKSGEGIVGVGGNGIGGFGGGQSGTVGLGRGGEGTAIGGRGRGTGTGSGTGDAPLDAGGTGKSGTGPGDGSSGIAGSGNGGGAGTGTGPGTGSGPGFGPGTGNGGDARNKPAGGGGTTTGFGSGTGKGNGLGTGLGDGFDSGTGAGSGIATLKGGRGSSVGAPAQPGGRGRIDAALDVVKSERVAVPSAQGNAKQGGAIGTDRPKWSAATGAVLKVTLGLVKHAGDWDSSPTAMHHLGTAFKDRCGLPEVDVRVITVPAADRAALAACNLVLVTSNQPIVYTDAECAALRAYVEGGGLLWINDSGASGDERFDTGLRHDLPRLFPGKKLLMLDVTHPFFNSAYNLQAGYKGYKIPPGDKYRQEYIEGIDFGERTRVIYTRNDYADGLEIDPRAIAGRMSLTDLTADEMLEGSLRFGINLIGYALGARAPQMPPPPEGAAQVEKIYRYHGKPIAAFDDFETNRADDGQPAWQPENWANPTTAELAALPEGGNALKITFKGGDKMKAAAGRNVELDLAGAKAIVLDLHSSMPHGFNVALLFSTRPNWEGFESRPIFVRPGWNRNLRFPLDLDDFKSAKTEWKSYDTPFQPRTTVGRIAFLLYNLNQAGEVQVDSLRIEKD